MITDHHLIVAQRVLLIAATPPVILLVATQLRHALGYFNIGVRVRR